MWARTFGQEDVSSPEIDSSNQENAWSVGSRWRNDLFGVEGLYVDVGEDFNPEVGFIRRRGIRRSLQRSRPARCRRTGIRGT